MKTILSLLALAAVALFQTGCSADASVGREGHHRHGVGVSAGQGQNQATRGAGVGVGAGGTGVRAQAY